MSARLGPVCYSDEEEHVFLGSEITRAKRHGEQISQLIDEEIRALLHRAHEEATRICKEHAKELKAIAEALLKFETLTSAEVQMVMEGKTAEDLLGVRGSKVAPSSATQGTPAAAAEKGKAAGDLPAPAQSPA